MSLRVGSAALIVHDQDRSLVEPELGLFGVFDGLGAYPQSAAAAELAKETVARHCRAAAEPGPLQLAVACHEADQEIEGRYFGSTTATVAWIAAAQLHYVSVGDSRLYHGRRGGELTQVTWDEGSGNRLDNALGLFGRRGLESVAPQRGTLRVQPGDLVLLVTDGVTGDGPPDLLDEADLAAATEGDDPERAARRLIEVARKHDDRTALVIFID